MQIEQENESLHQPTQRTESIVKDSTSEISSPVSMNAATRTVHDGERSFACPHCQHVFTRKHNLKSHLLTHSEKKSFNCSICSSKFRRLHDLKRHQKLHTGEKPHQCKNCGRKFARLDALVRHNNSQTGCMLLVDNSVIKGGSIGTGATTTEKPEPMALEGLAPSVSATNIIDSSAGTVKLPQQQQQQQISSTPAEPDTKSYPWKANQLPSISRLTPLANSETQPSLSQQQPFHQSILSHPVSLDLLSPENTKNFDLLPYVKLLESRVSLLESKLSSTDRKLSQLNHDFEQIKSSQTRSNNSRIIGE